MAKHHGDQDKQSHSSGPAKQRTPEEIKADIAASRENLTQTLGDLQGAVKEATNPKNIAKKVGDKIKGLYVSPDGQVNVKNVGITAGVIVGLVVLRKATHRKPAAPVQNTQNVLPPQK